MLRRALFSLLFFMILAGSSFFTFDYLNAMGYFNLKTIQLLPYDTTASQIISSGVLNREISNIKKELKKYDNISLFDLSLEDLNNLFVKESWINLVEIKRIWPDQIEVSIKVHDVSLLYWQNNETVIPILTNGKKLEPVSIRKAPPRVMTLDRQLVFDQDLRREAVTLIRNLEKDNKVAGHRVSEIGRTKSEGFWIDLVESDLRIKLGHNDWEPKLRRVAKVVEYVDQKQINARVIDANLKQKVLVRLRKDP